MIWSKYFWVRSAGFPFDWLERLGTCVEDPGVSKWIEARLALDALEARIDGSLAARDSGATAKWRRKQAAGAPAEAQEFPTPCRTVLAPLLAERTALLGALRAHQAEITPRFAQDTRSARARLVTFLCEPEVREAVFLSNPEALQRIDALTKAGVDKLDRRLRQRLRLGWNYLQRFCAKNDTASFFGPMAWGRFAGPDTAAIVLRREQGTWLKTRKTFFEYWVVDRLAQAVASDAELRDVLPIALNPGCVVEGNLLRVPIARTVQLSPAGAAILTGIEAPGAACVTRTGVIEHCVKRGFSVEEVTHTLDLLLRKGVLESRIRIPPGCEAPEAELAQAIKALPADHSRRAYWLRELASLEVLRADFAHGGLDERVRVLHAFGQRLHELGIDTSRAQGQMYIGRFPLYEDCARNLLPELGGEIVRIMQRELHAVMRLYAWLADAAASYIHGLYCQVFDQTARGGTADFLDFYRAVQARACGAQAVEALRPVVRKTWEALLLDKEAQDGEIRLDIDDCERLLELLRAQAPAPLRTRPLGANIHSPDCMIAASDLAAIGAGEFDIVIGEVHPAVHTVSQPVAQPFCPFPDKIAEEVSQVLAPRRIVLADSPQTYQRSHIDWLTRPELIQVVLPGGAARVPKARRIPAGGARIETRDGELWLVAGDFAQDVLTAAPGDFHRACFALSSELLGSSQPARLRMGKLILKRRSWKVSGEHCPKVERCDENVEGFLTWNAWAHSHGMPRYVFAKAPDEPKPIFVDFRNPHALDLLGSIARDANEIQFSEMRPAPHELWLREQRGRFCSEFRTSCSLPLDGEQQRSSPR